MPVKTLPRVLQHDNALFEEEWRTTCQTSYRKPEQREMDLLIYRNIPEIGLRQKKEIESMQEEAKVTIRKVPQNFEQFETIYRTQYVPKDSSDITLGKLVMKTQDGGEVKRDPTFLAETKIMDSQKAGRYLQQDIESPFKSQRLCDQEIPITFYSEKVASDKYMGTSVYGTLSKGKHSPFGKDSNFSKPISDYTKVVDDE
eukprot:TRINITY_DN59474_c0_g1_i1.p1 TRINITY_DN59474_c0_g1~~TRINITY_DN59474_c0_g1_i1.p1  ORF type:complete len:200 (+),score=26.33 TRINITY_DN59474_c0_g1_i1:280-879(+)